MTGNRNQCGILPRTLDTIFNSIQDSVVDKCVFYPTGKGNTFNIRAKVRYIYLLQQSKKKMIERCEGRSTTTQSEFGNWGWRRPIHWNKKSMVSCIHIICPCCAFSLKTLFRNIVVPFPVKTMCVEVDGYNDDYACALFVSYVEIYNNYCYDLLDNGPWVNKI